MEPFSFSAIASSPDRRRDSSPPVGLLTLAIRSGFARFFCRVRDETGSFVWPDSFSAIPRAQPIRDLGPQPLKRVGAHRRAHVAGWIVKILFVVARHEFG